MRASFFVFVCSVFTPFLHAQMIQCTVSIGDYSVSSTKPDGRTWDTSSGTVAPDPAFTVYVNGEYMCKAPTVQDRYQGMSMGSCDFSVSRYAAPPITLLIEDRDMLAHDLIGQFNLSSTGRNPSGYLKAKNVQGNAINFNYGYACH